MIGRLLARLTPLMACQVLMAAASAVAQSQLSVRVAEFEFPGKTRIDGHRAGAPGDLRSAALNLAHHVHLRICIETLPEREGRKLLPIEVSAWDRAVEEILQEMVRQDPRYHYRERLGVIEVLPTGAENDKTDCLNMVIPRFLVYYPWAMAWGQVKCQIDIISRDPNDIVLDPAAMRGCSGWSHLPHPPPTILRANFENETVRDILDQLASMAGDVAWYAGFDGPGTTCNNLALGEYQPTPWNRTKPEDPSCQTYAEGLPKKCTSCHYHKEAGEH